MINDEAPPGIYDDFLIIIEGIIESILKNSIRIIT